MLPRATSTATTTALRWSREANASTRTPCWSTSTSSGRHYRSASTELDSVDLGSLTAFAGRNTTVETVAEHIWTHVREGLAPASSLAALRVTVYESADAWASVDRPVVDGS